MRRERLDLINLFRERKRVKRMCFPASHATPVIEVVVYLSGSAIDHPKPRFKVMGGDQCPHLGRSVQNHWLVRNCDDCG